MTRRRSNSSREPALDAALTHETSRTASGARGLLRDVRNLILGARSQVAQSANASLTMLYWRISVRVRRETLRGKRARYGARIVAAVATRLESEFGRGFGEKNLRRMIQFAEQFPDEGIVAALLRQLGWTHFTLLLPIKSSLRREFYAEMCRIERWNTHVYAEKDLETAILREMELYLRWLDRHERKDNEAAPIGLILCAGKRQETIELLDLHSSGIKVSSYWTAALPKAALESKLHEAMRRAQLRLTQSGHEKELSMT